MKFKFTTSLVLVTASLFLAACGSTSSSDTASVNTGTAVYLDSAVAGVTVNCTESTSVTNGKGAFTFAHDQECVFAVGTIVLRTQASITQDQVIIEDNIRVAQFLQSMDFDGDASNGITIHQETANIMSQHNITNIPSNDQTLAEAVEAMDAAGIGYKGHFVYTQDAWDHMTQTMDDYGVPYPSQPTQPVQPALPTQPTQPNIPIPQ